ncbi:Inner membrane protein involved in colicin E2 resistance [Thioflavicoccus mobilis 8321]|uniref:Inner membrane protein involved in colicin E2 resistance n=1 Tax=Thioflavicoccus mobilis 8321 TaxID=765912 RepID=L0GYB9_9GAMM|nr:cell envelope integrity protein CreD [Thioflavicoccus mobilis]AGA90817.1 Inner membrane protein involved in colicin E2 resistance [Thioflavicoccus mobilis 8321]
MQKALLIKSAMTAGLVLALTVPLGMVDQLVRERAGRQHAVEAEIAASSAGAQTLLGPVLVLPYTQVYTESYWADEPVSGGTQRLRRTREVKKEGQTLIMPQLAQITLAGDTAVKRRGLFKAMMYDLDGVIEGHFEIPTRPEVDRQRNGKITWKTPYLSLGISDTRGVVRAPALEWDGTGYNFRQGARLGNTVPNGIHAELPSLIPDQTPSDTPNAPRIISFRIELGFRGTQSVGFVPLAENTQVALSSTWPHPSFQGRFLPNTDTQRINADGFHAEWEISGLATTAAAALRADLAAGRTRGSECAEWFGVRFIEPVNVYSLVDRALKYGILFIGLSFAAFFLFELLKSLRIHPAQYLLVGLALALFFLLLLSLSEHIDFTQAYLVATLACVGLQGFYLSHVLGSTRRGLSFAALLSMLFAALYGLLVSEDVALLMGSLLLFGLLALTMVLTRKLDWYALEPKRE